MQPLAPPPLATQSATHHEVDAAGLVGAGVHLAAAGRGRAGELVGEVGP